MFGQLERLFGRKVAVVGCAIWFAGLVIAIAVLSIEPTSVLRYARY